MGTALSHHRHPPAPGRVIASYRMPPDAIVTRVGHIVLVEVTDAEDRCPEGALGEAAWEAILEAARDAGGRAVRTDRALVLDQETGACDWSLGVQAVVDGLAMRGFTAQRFDTIWCPTCDSGPMREWCPTCRGEGHAREGTPAARSRGASSDLPT